MFDEQLLFGPMRAFLQLYACSVFDEPGILYTAMYTFTHTRSAEPVWCVFSAMAENIFLFDFRFAKRVDAY